MTDLERLLAVFTDLGIDFERLTPEQSAARRFGRQDSIVLDYEYGYVFEFDTDGKLTGHGGFHG